MTLEFDEWPRKTIGHLFYTISSCVHHFIAISELKLELQSGNSQLGLKSVIFCPVWPCNLTDDLTKQQGTCSMPLQALYIILWPSHDWDWSYSPETLNSGQNRQSMSRVTLKFDRLPWKTKGHLFCVASSFVHHLIAISLFKLELESGNAQFGSKSAMFCPVWPWNLTDDLQKQ